MNKKGFTLVEVILVIAILSLIVVILMPNIFVLIDNNNEKSCNNLINNIEGAAMIYVNNNKYELGFSCNSPGNIKSFTFQKLIDYGYLRLDGNMINPIDNSEISLGNVVNVTYDCSTKTFSYEVTGIDCTND